MSPELVDHPRFSTEVNERQLPSTAVSSQNGLDWRFPEGPLVGCGKPFGVGHPVPITIIGPLQSRRKLTSEFREPNLPSRRRPRPCRSRRRVIAEAARQPTSPV